MYLTPGYIQKQQLQLLKSLLSPEQKVKQAKPQGLNKITVIQKNCSYLDFFAIDVQGTDTKIYPNCVLLLLHENARLKALNDAGLSHV